MAITVSEFRSNPDIVLRYWLKEEHNIIISLYDHRPYELFSNSSDHLELRNWAVDGVTQPTFQELIQYPRITFEEIEEDEDLTEVTFDPTNVLLVVTERLFRIDFPLVTPTKKRLRQYIRTLSENSGVVPKDSKSKKSSSKAPKR